MLYTKYPESAIILGGDKNDMDISPILRCGLKLHQIVDRNTRKNKILDVIIMNTSGLYNSPVIAPPILPDNPCLGQPSDHSVPVCAPHTNRYTRPTRNYRIINYRPLPESSIKRFGEWIVSEQWNSINPESSPTDQAIQFEKLIKANLDKFCPEKQMKLGPKDKLFITAELKRISRLKSREYTKNGKTLKYLTLKRLFETKYKEEAQKYLHKNLEALGEAKPGQAFNVLKRLGAQPGDQQSGTSFSLPAFESESLTDQQCAERLADYFASISREFPPLNLASLTAHVQTKLQTSEKPPILSEYEVYCKIKAAKKPRSGVPSDVPKVITQEFSPELSFPVSRIINSMFQSYQWPAHWKTEHVIPIEKVPMPDSEDDLRPISLTPFFSKVAEHFVVHWLLEHVGHKLDFRQYGGLKGNSITHYIIEFVNFILSCQDTTDQTAILACMVDFSKAFNRQNHNILITKLSEMGVPGWLLKIVISFLEHRKMYVKYKGKHSNVKPLPGGGPQGTLLALLLFIILINDLGFEGQENKRNLKRANELHLKFVDDLTLAEAINMKNELMEVPIQERTHPVNYHARTGHVLPLKNSKVYTQLLKTKDYAKNYDMKLNFKKTNLMVFNPCTSKDFMPKMIIDNQELEVVQTTKLLGLIIRSDLKWISNTENMIKKANKRLWILRRLRNLGANKENLVEVYTKQVRCILELAAPAWQGSITLAEKQDLERVQKTTCHIILGKDYVSYSQALKTLNLESLEHRRNKLCLKFALKAEKHEKFRNWFKPSIKTVDTRSLKKKYCEVKANHTRFYKSPINFITRILNMHYK